MEITTETVTDYLLKINATKSTGPDGFSPKIRIPFALVLCPANRKWVMSPLSTKRVKRQTKTTISKIFGRVMFDQLYTSFASTFSSNMSGFLKAHSCASVDQINRWLETRSGLKERCGCGCHRSIKGFRLYLPQFTPCKIKSLLHTRASPSAYKIIFAWPETKGNIQRFKL